MSKSVYFNNQEYIVATSKEEAEEITKKTFGNDHLGHEAECEFYPLPQNDELTLLMENGKLSDGGEPTKKTAKEWIEFNGVGYLASVDF